MDDFMAALDNHDFVVEVGQIVKGKPAEFANDGVYVDIGGKSAAFLPNGEAHSTAVGSPEEWLPLGQEQEFLVVRGPNADGQVGLSLLQLEQRRAWDQLAEMVDSKDAIAVKVSGTNRGGVTVNVRGLRGFVPRSHLLQRDNLETLVGTKMNVTALEVSRERKKLVLSQRKAEQATLMANIAAGQFVSGTVSSLRPFGAFVNINGIDALLHIKQISQAHVPSVEQVFSVGETVRAIVADVDEWKGRIALMTFPFENYKGEVLEEKEKVMAEAAARYAQLYPNKADAEGSKDEGVWDDNSGDQSAVAIAGDEGKDDITQESPASNESDDSAKAEKKVEPVNEPSAAETVEPKKEEAGEKPSGKKTIDLTAAKPKIVSLNPKPQRSSGDEDKS
ncbi:MAG: S1 RNA-binding domain-containing protein [Cyanophyceae cyanobacterium]